jgi:2',3'-cyclic-nucleotide 2'-phosphodiesterase (5'-nucleotidase family)
MRQRDYLGVCALISSLALSAPVMADRDGDQRHHSEGRDITIIHTGDFHGHLVPRPNMRSDATGQRLEGGLARIYTKIKEIREEDPKALLLHTGDSIQGSAEVLYTRGQAMVDVVNVFGVDAYAPGNWEFVYGTERFKELFVGRSAKANWNAIAANVKSGSDKYGPHVLPPYMIKNVNGVKIGLLGLTTDRGPQVVGNVFAGLYFLQNANGEVDAEVAKQVDHLRNVKKVDLVVLMSEMGLANNIRIAENVADIDLVLSSDMHEETQREVVVYNKDSGHRTILVEEGQDGTMMGKFKLKVKDGRIADYEWTPINVNDRIKEDRMIAYKIEQVRKSFVSGPYFTKHVNPFNGSKLKRPIDTVVGYTTVPLHRSNFAGEDMPAVIEGSSHDFLADAFRGYASQALGINVDIGAIRGFRYGTHVAAGPIKQEDLYHFMPIGPQIAVGTIKGQVLKNQIENAANGSLNPDVSKWTGGWCFNFSGVTMDLDPYATLVGTVPYALDNGRASNIRVNGDPLVLSKAYTYASYWYAINPGQINVINASNITVLKDDNGEPLDGAEVVVKYLASQPNKTVSPLLNRTTLTSPLPPYRFGFPEVQPLRGAQY